MSIKPIMMESHMHTTLCRHAVGELREYAEVALARGLRGMTVTCHCPLPEGISPGVRMRNDDWPRYVEMVAECREEFKGRLDVRLGLESDYLPGLEEWLEELHQREPLHHVLGSVHPQLGEYKALYLDEEDWPAFQRQYFVSLAEAAETGLFDTLSHPDLVKNQAPDDYDLEALLPHICDCLDRIAATGTAMELNTSGKNKALPEMNPSLPILKETRKRDIPMVIGADAHEPGRVAADYPEALRLLQEAGYDRVRYFLERKPVDVPITEALQSLRI
jgi:histidinol-phosphatase (PHP family)